MICYLPFLNWCETSFFWHLLLLLLSKKCSLNHKAIMCEKKQKEQAQEEAKNEAFASLPQRQTSKSPFCFTPRFLFSVDSINKSFPWVEFFLGRGLGVTIWNDLWIPGKIPNLLSALSKKYTLYICLVVTSDYLRVSNHAILVLGMTTIFSYSKFPFLKINHRVKIPKHPFFSNWLQFHLQMYVTL